MIIYIIYLLYYMHIICICIHTNNFMVLHHESSHHCGCHGHDRRSSCRRSFYGCCRLQAEAKPWDMSQLDGWMKEEEQLKPPDERNHQPTHTHAHTHMYIRAYKCIRHPISFIYECVGHGFLKLFVNCSNRASEHGWTSLMSSGGIDASERFDKPLRVSVSKLRVSGSTGDGMFQVFLSKCWWYLSFMLLVAQTDCGCSSLRAVNVYNKVGKQKKCNTPTRPHTHTHVHMHMKINTARFILKMLSSEFFCMLHLYQSTPTGILGTWWVPWTGSGKFADTTEAHEFRGELCGLVDDRGWLSMKTFGIDGL